MEVLYITGLILITIIAFLSLKHLEQKKNQLPPSPPGLPILGHLHLLKGPVHRALKSLSDKYGPIIYIRLGNRPTVVVSSASLVEECLSSRNDIVLANRPQSLLADIFSYSDAGGIAFSPYGEHWRNVRRITTIHIFSSLSLERSAEIRVKEIRFYVQKMFKSSIDENLKQLNLTCLFQDLVRDVVMKMICGKRWSASADDFNQIISISSITEYIPILRWIGFNGAEKKAKKLFKQTDEFLQGLIDEYRRNGSSSGSIDKHKKTILQIYLSLQESDQEFYSDNLIKMIIESMFTAGIDTSVLTMQWVMAYLLNHPEVMENARKEIDNRVTTGRLIEDSDLAQLPYLGCIISETLRLFPAAPLLLPHLSSEDCTINGYKIPKGTTFLFNAWAIHRDPNLWDEPTKFKPERFEGVEVGSEGFKYLPFGRGRRSCPGNTLALRLAGLAIGTMIQCFEWKRSGTEMMDLDDEIGVAMHKVKPFLGFYRPRQATIHLLSQL